MKLILKNATIIDPSQNLNKEGTDILIVDGIIESIGSIQETEDVKVIDLKGRIVSPGFFDMHVHLREPGREDEETVKSGCRAAAAGGFTGIASMPNTEPAVDSAEIVDFIKKQAKGN
jgi:dihydroorotase